MDAIVIYSETGNTRLVAIKINEIKKVDLLEIIPENDDPNITSPVFKKKPDVKSYDHIILGSPVHGFTLPHVTKTYLTQTRFDGKTVDLFITHFFPFAWMGGNQTLKLMKWMVEQQGGIVGKVTCINWKNKKREKDIETLVSSYQK